MVNDSGPPWCWCWSCHYDVLSERRNLGAVRLQTWTPRPDLLANSTGADPPPNAFSIVRVEDLLHAGDAVPTANRSPPPLADRLHSGAGVAALSSQHFAHPLCWRYFVAWSTNKKAGRRLRIKNTDKHVSLLGLGRRSLLVDSAIGPVGEAAKSGRRAVFADFPCPGSTSVD